MAMANVLCHCEICGKDFAVRVEKYNRRDAEQFESWAPSHYTVCRKCEFEMKKKAEHEAAPAVSDGLPPLEGTEKQISWAFDIRGKFTDLSMLSPQGTAFFKENILGGKTSASWWIDHKGSKDAGAMMYDIALGWYGSEEKDELLAQIDEFKEMWKK